MKKHFSVEQHSECAVKLRRAHEDALNLYVTVANGYGTTSLEAKALKQAEKFLQRAKSSLDDRFFAEHTKADRSPYYPTDK
jgi:hypothetical protein